MLLGVGPRTPGPPRFRNYEPAKTFMRLPAAGSERRRLCKNFSIVLVLGVDIIKRAALADFLLLALPAAHI